MTVNYEVLNQVVEKIKEAKNIVVLSGAGLSVSAGIPDFRSHDGFYNNPPEYLKKYGMNDPSDIFDISFFKKDPLPFFEFGKSFLSQEYVPTCAHYFIQEIHKRGKLRRYYTQNVDGLDEKTGDYGNKLVYCHGSFTSATCIKCQTKHDSSIIIEACKSETLRIPKCDECEFGVVKPDVVFFGEQLPDNYHKSLKKDTKVNSPVDMLIVLGTSLSVAPVSFLPYWLPKGIPMVFINRDRLKEFEKHDKNLTFFLEGDLQDNCNALMEQLGWHAAELESTIEETEVTLKSDEGTEIDIVSKEVIEKFSRLEI